MHNQYLRIMDQCSISHLPEELALAPPKDVVCIRILKVLDRLVEVDGLALLVCVHAGVRAAVVGCENVAAIVLFGVRGEG
jgi:hypothetical protein